LTDTAPTPEDLASVGEALQIIEGALAALLPRDRLILETRFGLGRDFKTQAELGNELRISRPRVAQCEKRALKTLRSPCVRRYMRDALESLRALHD